MEKLPKKPIDIFDTGRYIIGAIAILVGLYIFTVRGEEPSLFFWAMGSGLIGGQYILDFFTKRK